MSVLHLQQPINQCLCIWPLKKPGTTDNTDPFKCTLGSVAISDTNFPSQFFAVIKLRWHPAACLQPPSPSWAPELFISNNNHSQSVVPRPAASTESENLSEMQIHGFHPVPWNHKPCRWDPAVCCNQPSRGPWCVLQFEKHWAITEAFWKRCTPMFCHSLRPGIPCLFLGIIASSFLSFQNWLAPTHVPFPWFSPSPRVTHRFNLQLQPVLSAVSPVSLFQECLDHHSPSLVLPWHSPTRMWSLLKLILLTDTCSMPTVSPGGVLGLGFAWHWVISQDLQW